MKIGVIGTGSIVSAFVSSARLVKGVDFKAVYSRKQETGDKFALANRIERVYTDLDQMLADDDLDTIYVASPNALHYEHALKALHADKHVIVEKPFVGNIKKAEALIQLSKDKSLFLFEAICNIHMPHMKYIEKRLQELGKIRLIQCNYSQYSSRYDALLRGETPNVFNPEMSGGALADINIYNIHFTVYLFGMPQKIEYIANLHENGIDTSGILILDYGNFKASLVGAKDSASYNIAQIQGETGHIVIPNGSNSLESVLFTTTETRKEIVEHDKPRLTYQVEVFKDMVDRRDYILRDTYLNHSLNVVRVANEALKQVGLDFEY